LKDRKSHTIYHFLVCCCFRILVNIWKRCLVYLWIKVARDHKLNNLLINYLSAKIKLQEVHGNSDMSLDGYHVPNVFVNLCFCDFWKISRHNRSHLWDRIHQCVFYWIFFEYLWFRFRVVLNYTISFDISTMLLDYYIQWQICYAYWWREVQLYIHILVKQMMEEWYFWLL
jgi:hypothetical protein